MLIVLTGKTSSGKDTILKALIKKYPNSKKVTTTTSRTPRPDEQDGIDYHFISKDQFQAKIKAGDFIEYVEYGGNLYGTDKSELEQTLTHDAIWKIDPSRAGQIRKLISQPLLVIYLTTSDEVVLQRLKERNLSSEEIAKRMVDDKKIWDQYKDHYDFVVENVPGKLDESIDKITTILATQGETLRA